MKRLALLILFLLPGFFIFSQTIIDTYNVNGTWTKNGSPYLITTDMAVASYDTLVIEAGVKVIFQDYYMFQVFGHFSAIGNATDTIWFTVADTTGFSTNNHTGWAGLDLEPDSYCSGIQYCVMEYSKSSGIFIQGGPELTIYNSTFQYNYYGLLIVQATVNIDQVKVLNNLAIGAYYYYDSHGIVTNIEASGNDGRGLSCDNFNLPAISVNDGLFINNPGGGMYIGYQTGIHASGLTFEGNGSGGLNGGAILGSGECYLDNLSINNNTADNGGGIANDSYGFEVMEVTNSLISNNTALNNGGGIWDQGDGISLSGVEILNNNAVNGGGIYGVSGVDFVLLDSLTISNNSATQNGGGIFIYVPYQFGLSGSKITSNTAQNGAGMYIDNTTSLDPSSFVNLEITSNQASVNGGGMFYFNDGNYTSNTFRNLSIVQNTAGQSGGSVFCAISYDTIRFINSISWNNSPDEIIDTSGNFRVTYSNIEGGYAGTGNINANPLFQDQPGSNFHLEWENFPLEDTSKSPCIDTGDPTTPSDPDGTIADMGAYPFNRTYHEQFQPVINSIQDVPDDQGMQVVLNWFRSPLDTSGGSIDSYTIWRLQNWTKDPWEYLASIPAQHFDEYAYIAPTVSDSNATGIHYFTFIVSAVNSDSSKFYYAYPDSGYSVDNIAPNPPGGIDALLIKDTVFLNWEESGAVDFDHFAVYKSASKDNFSDTAFILTNDTIFADAFTNYDTLYYIITAFDKNGNESHNSDTVEIPVRRLVPLDLKVFLEGPFAGSQMSPDLNGSGSIPHKQPYNSPPWNYGGEDSVEAIPSANVIDWLLVDMVQPEATENPDIKIIGQKAVLLLNDGTVIDPDGSGNLIIASKDTTNFYVRINHRNHLPVLSSGVLTKTGNLFSWDFSIGSEMAYGDSVSQKELETGIWGMIAGDANADGQIDNRDKNEFWLIQSDSIGYFKSDFNMDGEVDELDKTMLWDVNAGNGIQIPEASALLPWQCGDQFIDPRDGRSYKTILTGDQCWMAQNLNFGSMIDSILPQADNGIPEKYCVGNSEDSCSVYGGLYEWDEAMQYEQVPASQGICPEGWHLPDNTDWCELENFADEGLVNCDVTGWRGTNAGYNLKANHGWIDGGNGTDLFGFSSLAAGYRQIDGYFDYKGSFGFYWTSADTTSSHAWARTMGYSFNQILRGNYKKIFGFSVRCVKD